MMCSVNSEWVWFLETLRPGHSRRTFQEKYKKLKWTTIDTWVRKIRNEEPVQIQDFLLKEIHEELRGEGIAFGVSWFPSEVWASLAEKFGIETPDGLQDQSTHTGDEPVRDRTMDISSIID